MARYAGLVGYVTQVETYPGVWSSIEESILMKGNILRQNSHNREREKVNDDVTLSHRVSLIGDAYSLRNYYNIKWIEIDGAKWKVQSVEYIRPRITVGLGGLWNGE